MEDTNNKDIYDPYAEYDETEEDEILEDEPASYDEIEESEESAEDEMLYEDTAEEVEETEEVEEIDKNDSINTEEGDNLLSTNKGKLPAPSKKATLPSISIPKVSIPKPDFSKLKRAKKEKITADDSYDEVKSKRKSMGIKKLLLVVLAACLICGGFYGFKIYTNNPLIKIKTGLKTWTIPGEFVKNINPMEFVDNDAYRIDVKAEAFSTSEYSSVSVNKNTGHLSGFAKIGETKSEIDIDSKSIYLSTPDKSYLYNFGDDFKVYDKLKADHPDYPGQEDFEKAIKSIFTNDSEAVEENKKAVKKEVLTFLSEKNIADISKENAEETIYKIDFSKEDITFLLTKLYAYYGISSPIPDIFKLENGASVSFYMADTNLNRISVKANDSTLSIIKEDDNYELYEGNTQIATLSYRLDDVTEYTSLKVMNKDVLSVEYETDLGDFVLTSDFITTTIEGTLLPTKDNWQLEISNVIFGNSDYDLYLVMRIKSLEEGEDIVVERKEAVSINELTPPTSGFMPPVIGPQLNTPKSDIEAETEDAEDVEE